jgi:hypothetical protein
MHTLVFCLLPPSWLDAADGQILQNILFSTGKSAQKQPITSTLKI